MKEWNELQNDNMFAYDVTNCTNKKKNALLA